MTEPIICRDMQEADDVSRRAPEQLNRVVIEDDDGSWRMPIANAIFGSVDEAAEYFASRAEVEVAKAETVTVMRRATRGKRCREGTVHTWIDHRYALDVDIVCRWCLKEMTIPRSPGSLAQRAASDRPLICQCSGESKAFPDTRLEMIDGWTLVVKEYKTISHRHTCVSRPVVGDVCLDGLTDRDGIIKVPEWV